MFSEAQLGFLVVLIFYKVSPSPLQPSGQLPLLHIPKSKTFNVATRSAGDSMTTHSQWQMHRKKCHVHVQSIISPGVCVQGTDEI